MVNPYIAICPTCGCKTNLIIQKSDYLPEYSVRVHCGKCKSLIKGVFYSDETIGGRGLVLFNAETIIPNVDSDNKVDAEYIVEISGELPTKTVQKFEGQVGESSPFMRMASLADADALINYIEQLETFLPTYLEWRGKYLTAFELLQDGSLGYIPYVLNPDLKNRMCTTIEMLEMIHNIALRYTGFLFYGIQKIYLDVIHDELDRIKPEKMQAFLKYLNGSYNLTAVYTKVISVFVEFMQLYPVLLPAEAMIQLSVEEYTEETGISTCTFSELKGFYQDAYETILAYMDIPVCLDNIAVRGKWNAFVPNLINKNTGSRVESEENYNKLDKGKKLQFIDDHECFQGFIRIPANSNIRNGIGHNNIRFDGETLMLMM